MSDRLLIRDQVSIADALEMLDLSPPDRSGKINCPLHEENTPSCQVYDDHFHCFGCGANGDVVWFVACVTGTPLWKAEKYLLGATEDLPAPTRREPEAREVKNLTPLWLEQEPVGPSMREFAGEFCDKRWGLPIEIVMQYTKVNRDGLWIPYYFDNDIVGIKIRKWSGEKTSVPGSTFNLGPYLGWVTSAPTDTVVLCEGEPDTWAMRHHLDRPGCPPVYVIGLPSGASSFPDTVKNWITARAKNLVLALDNDKAGRDATARITEALPAVDGFSWLDLAPEMGKHGKDVCDALRAGWTLQFKV